MEGLSEACPLGAHPRYSENEKIRFHTLNRKNDNRVVSRYIEEETGRPVDEDDEAKGYERGEGDFLVLEEEELHAVRLESARTIDIVRDPHDLLGEVRDADPDPQLLGLIGKLIDERKASWSAELVRDPVQERLSDIINEKKKGPHRARPPVTKEKPINVVNIGHLATKRGR
jgi:non-homologous end joining protein Ku